jgi:hypothetical protein
MNSSIMRSNIGSVLLQSIKQLSKEQNISVSQIRKMIKWGLPHYRIKKKILIDQNEFAKWFQAQYRVENETQDEDLEGRIDSIFQQFKSR